MLQQLETVSWDHLTITQRAEPELAADTRETETSASGCYHKSEGEIAVSKTIEIVAKIDRFAPNAMTDDFGDGNFASYDATEVEILAPSALKGRKVLIYHNDKANVDSLWRNIHGKLRFSIREDDLKSETLLFDGAIWNLRE